MGILGAGVLALLALRGATVPYGGFESPDAAVAAVVGSANNGDVVALLSAVAPSELAGIANVYRSIEAKAESAGIVPQGSGASPPGLQIKISGLQTRVELLAPDIAAVHMVAGHVEGGIDPTRFPVPVETRCNCDDPVTQHFSVDISDVNRELVERAEHSSRQRSMPADLFVVTVRSGGRWFVSPFYSASEYARRIYNLPLPDFGATGNVQGAKTPGAAVESLARAVGAIDADAGVAALSPVELRFLYDYRRSFLGFLAPGDLDVARRNFSIRLRALKTREEMVSADVAKVTVTEASGSIVLNDRGTETFEFSLAGDCLSTSQGGRSSRGGRWCSADLERILGNRVAATDDESRDQHPPIHIPLREPFVVAVKSGDGWFVSPMATIREYLKIGIDQFKSDDLRSLVGPLSNDPQFVASSSDRRAKARLRRTYVGTDPSGMRFKQDLNGIYWGSDAAVLPVVSGIAQRENELGVEFPTDRVVCLTTRSNKAYFGARQEISRPGVRATSYYSGPQPPPSCRAGPYPDSELPR